MSKSFARRVSDSPRCFGTASWVLRAESLCAAKHNAPRRLPVVRDAVRELVQATPFVDTHEHLLEESTRLSGSHRLLPCRDAALLFHHYAGDDLWSAGLTADEQ